AAAALIDAEPRLKAQASSAKEKRGRYLAEAVDLVSGKSLGSIVVDTGKDSFSIKMAFAAGDWIAVLDTENRVLVYSISEGRLAGKAFGGKAALSPASRLLCVENEAGKLALYDMAGMEKRDEFTFSSDVTLAQFSPDGKRLFVLTASQAAYVLDMSSYLH
ncbi:MAG TPA: hypothetical protein VLZ81_15845, partial [Blastocatellia bacterium]|nr:hypothetical protein [Blastocatellia bacterium]